MAFSFIYFSKRPSLPRAAADEPVGGRVQQGGAGVFRKTRLRQGHRAVFAGDRAAVHPDTQRQPLSDTHLSATQDNHTFGVIAVTQDLAVLYMDRGIAYAATDQIDPAINDFDRAIYIWPSLAEAYCRRGPSDLKKMTSRADSMTSTDRSDLAQTFRSRSSPEPMHVLTEAT